MITKDDLLRRFYEHYSLLESDFVQTKQFVTVSEDNYGTYSTAFLKLLLTLGSEVDVMLKLVADLYEKNHGEEGFGCSKILLKHEKDIQQIEVFLKKENISVFPWRGGKTQITKWWTAYNEIKHHRYEPAILLEENTTKENYQFANLENTLNALAALFTLELYAYRKVAMDSGEEMTVPNVNSIFGIKNSHWEKVTFGNGIIVIGDSLYISGE